MHGRGEDTAFNHWSNSAVFAPSLPSLCRSVDTVLRLLGVFYEYDVLFGDTLPTAASLCVDVTCRPTPQQYQLGQQLGLSCHHPIDGYHPSPLPRLAGAGHRSSLLSRRHSQLASLAHRLCLMLIGLARPNKVSATVKLCF